MKKTVALIGSGAIGSIIATHLPVSYTLVGILSQSLKSATSLAEKTNTKTFSTIQELVAEKPDYVIEAAGVAAVASYGKEILQGGCHFIPLSIGAFADGDFFQDIKETAKKHHVQVHIPSGAIGGFDLMRTLHFMESPEVTITNVKPPSSLEGAPYLKNRSLSPTHKEAIFLGSAKDAIAGFPQNVNVAVATALATRGMDETQVSIISDPESTVNSHSIHLKNSQVEAHLQIVSLPSPENPKSSTITPWSVIALLEQLSSPIQFF